MGKDQDLIEAARAGNYPQCEKLLMSKPKRSGPFASLRRPHGGINSRDGSGYTALHYAALNGHKHIVELLLSYEASCNSADEKGSSPLHLAAWAGGTAIVETLLTHGPSIANVNLRNSDAETALHCGSQHGHASVVRVLLAHGADPNIKNAREETPLDLAALYGRKETVGLLLDSHPELLSPFTAYGGAIYTHTPLHLASRNGHRDVVEMILKTGFDLNVRTTRGTALHEAAVCGKVEVVRTLLDANINLELRDADDKSVIEVMDELKTPVSTEIMHIIIDHMGILRRQQKPRQGKSSSSGRSRPRPTAPRSVNLPATTSVGNRGSTASVHSTSSTRSAYSHSQGIDYNAVSMESIESGSISIALASDSTCSLASTEAAAASSQPPINSQTLPLPRNRQRRAASSVEAAEGGGGGQGHTGRHGLNRPRSEARARSQSRDRWNQAHGQDEDVTLEEDLNYDQRRISALSTTSGCSDCTTATLQGARSLSSSFFSCDDTLTPNLGRALDTSSEDEFDDAQLLDDDEDTSVASSANSSVQSTSTKEDTNSKKDSPIVKKKNTTLTRDNEAAAAIAQAAIMQKVPPPVAPKPVLPAKPNLFRAGLNPAHVPRSTDLKPVPQIPPRKPPRRTVSSSPGKAALAAEQGSESCQDGDDSGSAYDSEVCLRRPTSSSYQSGSKSFDELDDHESVRQVRRSSTRKKNRRAMSSGADYMQYQEKLHQKQSQKNQDSSEDSSAPHTNAPSSQQLTVHRFPVSRHSCDELMTRSFHGCDASASADDMDYSCPGDRRSATDIGTAANLVKPSSMSSRTMSLDADELWRSESSASSSAASTNHQPQFLSGRFISQRQYKRKIKRDCPSYVTLERRRSNGSRRHAAQSVSVAKNELEIVENGDYSSDTLRRMRMVSKTTYKLRALDDLALVGGGESLLTSAEAGGQPENVSLELMEVPLSPTNYDQPPTPDHDPPHPFEAERDICNVIEQLRSEAKRMKRSKGTEVESWYFSQEDAATTSIPMRTKRDQETCMNQDVGKSSAKTGPPVVNGYHKVEEQPSPVESTESKSPPIKESSEEPRPASEIEAKSTNAENEQPTSPSNRHSGGNLSILSPFDEQEEWNKISKIIDSFGADIGNKAKESTTPHNSPDAEYPTVKRKEESKDSASLSDWLRDRGLAKYEEHLVAAGYDRLQFLGPDALANRDDLSDVGISEPEDADKLLTAIQENKCTPALSELEPESLDDWLSALGLTSYSEQFHSNFFTTVERVAAIWDDELTSILDMDKVGHRRRILLSAAGSRDAMISRIGKVPETEAEKKEKIRKRLEKEAEVAKKLKKEFEEEEEDKGRSVPMDTASPPSERSLGPPPPIAPKPSLEARTAALGYDPSTRQEGGNSSSSSTASSTNKKGHNGNNSSNGNNGFGTLGRSSRKKKAAPQPPTPTSQPVGIVAVEIKTDDKEPSARQATTSSSKSSTSTGAKSKKAKSVLEEKGYLTYKVKYFGKRHVKDFQGNETTKAAIEVCRKSAASAGEGKSKSGSGRTRFLKLSERSIKVLKRDGKEVIIKHPVQTVCCVVRDTVQPGFFGYITANESGSSIARHTHVFSTDCVGKTSEILKVICEGFSSALATTKCFHQDPLTDLTHATPPSPPGDAKDKTSSNSGSASATTTPSRFRSGSEHLVSRMKLFFQGGSGASVERKNKSPTRKENARRKRGGSVDNLLDDLDDEHPLTTHSKKKSISTKNLSSGDVLEKMKVTDV